MNSLRKFILPCALFSFVFAAPPTFANSFHDNLSREFIENKIWDDGNAEINIYQAGEIRYGIARESEVAHIFVKESHKPDLLVKADDWKEKGLMEVMKFNYSITVPTGVYSYRQMLSVFFEKKSFYPIKMTFGSQEWCGNSFKEIVNFNGKSFINFITYWDHQGSGMKTLGLEEGLPLYDALPILLRAVNMKQGGKVQFPMLPSQISSKLTPFQPESATLAYSGKAMVEVPVGKFSAKGFSVSHSKGEDLFWFAEEFPHVMLKWKRHDGTQYLLRKTLRLDYWNKTGPGDEKYLQ